MPIVLPIRVHTDARRPRTVRVKDANGMDLGLIHQHNGYWTNYPPDNESGVPIGPFRSMEAAFEAFRSALGDAE